MSAAGGSIGAWNGDPARKQAAIAAARVRLAALAADPVVTCDPTLRLGELSNVYCAAYGTAAPAELEARAGLPVSTLMLASAALLACEHWGRQSPGGAHVPRMSLGAEAAPLVALEAIPPGTDPIGLACRYIVDLLEKIATLHDGDGRGLAPGQQALIHQLATLHRDGCADAAAFRTLRRMAMAATDVATGDLATSVLRFVESAAWPLTGLLAELPWMIARLHLELRVQFAPERPTSAEQATLESLSALYRALDQRSKVEPTLDVLAERARIETTPEYAAVNDPAFQARLDRYDRAAARAHVPFALDLLLRAFSMR